MASAVMPACTRCSTIKSIFWYRVADSILCNDCFSHVDKSKNSTSGKKTLLRSDNKMPTRFSNNQSTRTVSNLKLRNENNAPRNGNNSPLRNNPVSRSNSRVRNGNRNSRNENNSPPPNETDSPLLGENERQPRRTTRQRKPVQNSSAPSTATAVYNSKKSVPKPRSQGPTVKKVGKSRRSIVFKQKCMKAPSPITTIVTSKYLYFQGQLFTVGDIVSCYDSNMKKYYCQLRGFMMDQYCEKSGIITWLIPSDNSPPPESGFDPTSYMIGPNEDIPRKLAAFTFEMHCPPEFEQRNGRFPPSHNSGDFSNIYAPKFLSNSMI